MPDNENLRFVLELKDEFSKVFEDAFKNVLSKSPKIIDGLNNIDESGGKVSKTIGGLSKTMKVLSAGLLIGGTVYASWQAFKNKIVESQKAAKRLEVTLGNIVGSRGSAKKIFQELASSDLSKVFDINDINEGYARLANAGTKATTKQLSNVGDLAANTGSTFGNTIGIINSASSGQLKSLKELGISYEKIKDKKKGIDAIEFSFRGQKTTIDNTSTSIRQYLLGLGSLETVHGSMGRSLDSLNAKDNALNNELDKTWSILAENWAPEVKAARGWMTKFVGTINSWIETPTSQKIQEEVMHLEGLRVKLGYTNTSEEERRDILRQVKDEQPGLIDNTKSEKEQLASLNGVLDEYLKKRRQQIALEQVKENNIGAVTRMNEILEGRSQILGKIDPIIGRAVTMGLDVKGMSQGQQQMAAKKFFQDRIKSGNTISTAVGGAYGGYNNTTEEQKLLNELKILTEKHSSLGKEGEDLLPDYEKYIKTVAAVKKLLPDSDSEINRISDTRDEDDDNDNGTSIDKGGIASVSGGGQIKNVTININNLVSGGVNVSTTTLKEGVSKAKDIVVEGLLTAVNDANLVGN